MESKDKDSSNAPIIPNDVPESFFEIVSGLLSAIEEADSSESQ